MAGFYTGLYGAFPGEGRWVMADHRFPDGFLWGAATASYQVEGAVRDDGRGESIWDRFSHAPGRIADGQTGDTACDHYHRWRNDIENMRALGLRAYRFSIAWPRVFPAGRGKINRAGLDFYSALVDGLLESGIQPVPTLYHWDLPQALQDAGGWPNRDTARYFADYAVALFAALGDRVTRWITVNEPWVAAFLGHALGVHAPGATDFGAALQAGHVLLLGHALALQAYPQVTPRKGRIGISLDLHPVYPATDSPEDGTAARVADGYQNRWFLDAVYRGTYPEDMLTLYRSKGKAPKIQPGDSELLGALKPDFLGVNYYFPLRVFRTDRHHPILGYQTVVPPGSSSTEMEWEVYPPGLADILTRVAADYGNPEMYITENGAACRDDRVSGGQVQDDDRIAYLRDHLRECSRAIGHGVNLKGYFLWSLMDNFEWSFGYSRRFGITHVDFKTQGRTWKKSASWYQRVIAAGGGAALD
jgi:beta-glucosidase